MLIGERSLLLDGPVQLAWKLELASVGKGMGRICLSKKWHGLSDELAADVILCCEKTGVMTAR
jgi:hypothetical protein